MLKQFITLAEEMKDEEIDKYQNQLKLISDYAINPLFNSEKTLFVTNVDEYNIASQVWMVLAKVMPDEMNHKIMESTIKNLFPVKNIIYVSSYCGSSLYGRP